MAFKTFEQPVEAAGRMKASSSGGGGETIAAVLRALFSFRGTATRLEFWLVTLVLAVIAMTISVATVKLTGVPLEEIGDSQPQVLLLPNLILMWLGWAVTTRRLRDRGWSTELILSVIVGTPVVGIVGLAFAPVLLVPIVLVNIWASVECMFLGSVDV